MIIIIIIIIIKLIGYKKYWNAECLKELRSEWNETKQGNIQITTEMVTDGYGWHD